MRARHWRPNQVDQPTPCNGCTLCCEGGDTVRLYPHEDASRYITQPHPAPEIFGPGTRALAHKPNGDCVYLERGVGCTIHGPDRPHICKTMDCRTVAAKIPPMVAATATRKTVNGLPCIEIRGGITISLDVLRKGRELLKATR